MMILGRRPSIGRRLALVGAAAALAFAAARARAWDETYVGEAVTNGLAAARQAKDLSGFSARSDGLCVVGGWIAADGHLAFTVKLRQGTEYLFIGSGDSDAKDLDLEAVEDGKVIAQDDDDDSTPVVGLIAEGDGQATLKLKLESCKATHSFAVLIMLESTKVKAKLDNIEKAGAQLAAAVDAIAGDSRFVLDHGENTVSFACMLLEPGASMAFERHFSRKAEYVIIGAADNHCKDLDLEVSKDGDSVSDEDEDATPVVHFQVQDKGKVKVKLTAHDASKRTFAVCAVLSNK